MEEQIKRLVSKLQEKSKTHPRYLVAISGIPGSGKTTLAATVTARINASSPGLASFIPMDGYHLSRAQLSALPNAEEAHARRGAAFTFDGPAFLAMVKAIRAQAPTSETLYAPSFDHARKDPKYDDIPILAETKILLFEGLYLSLDKKPWNEAAALMDELWFIEVGFEEAETRLVERHIRTGVAGTKEEARDRARGSDLINGTEIVKDRMAQIDEIVTSMNDDEWKAVV